MIDWVEVVAKAGKGGDGVIAFRHEKFVPFGGPDGGNGGNGGDVVVRADPSISDLRRFNSKGIYRAEDGRHGQGKKMQGKRGEDLVLAVPPGTIVSLRTPAGDTVLADLEEEGQKVLVSRGGKGGWGNVHYATSINQAPQIAQRGEAGEEKSLILEMRLIADVGIIAYPNVGKSTLLAAASSAHPKIASYPFTTLEPILGVVEVGKESFTLAEIPGLIEGAHMGKGLGHDFLRHAMRTKMFLHMVDASSASPVEDLVHVNAELSMYDPVLAQRPQVVVLNKIDLPEAAERLDEIKAAFESAGIAPRLISAATGQGVPELMAHLAGQLSQLAREREAAPSPAKVFRPAPRAEVSVHKEGDVFILEAPELERLVTRGGAAGPEIRWQLKRQFARLGVNRALDKAGVKPGDKVRCGHLEWEW